MIHVFIFTFMLQIQGGFVYLSETSKFASYEDCRYYQVTYVFNSLLRKSVSYIDRDGITRRGVVDQVISKCEDSGIEQTNS